LKGRNGKEGGNRGYFLDHWKGDELIRFKAINKIEGAPLSDSSGRMSPL